MEIVMCFITIKKGSRESIGKNWGRNWSKNSCCASKELIFVSMANIHSTNKWLCFISIFGNGTELGLFQFKIVWFFFCDQIHLFMSLNIEPFELFLFTIDSNQGSFPKLKRKTKQNCFFFVFLPCHPIWDSTQNTFHHSQVLTIIVRLK